MPTNNARGHVIPSGDEASFTRDTLFRKFGESINDIVPVANVAERSQLVSRLTTAGVGPTSTRPLVVLRADAPAAHRLEYTYDGSVWLPGSGTFIFDSTSAADSFAVANPGYLTVGDIALIAGTEVAWLGSKWGHITNVTLGTGWASAGAGYTPRAYAIGRMSFVVGAVVGGAGASQSSMLTIPADFRPSNPSTRLVGSGVTSGGKAFEMAISNGVVLIPPGYATTPIPLSEVYPITLSWLRD